MVETDEIIVEAYKREWVEALRSGEYDQTRGTLRDEHGFCCLGVLCDLSGVGEWSQKDEYGDIGYKIENASFDEIREYHGGLVDAEKEKGKEVIYHGSVPARIRNKLGYTTEEVSMFARLNDDGKTFEELADVIERMI